MSHDHVNVCQPIFPGNIIIKYTRENCAYEGFSVPCWKYSHHITFISNVLDAGKLFFFLSDSANSKFNDSYYVDSTYDS